MTTHTTSRAAIHPRQGRAEKSGPARDLVPEDEAMVLKNIFFLFALVFRYPSDDIYTAIEEHLDNFGGFFLEYAKAVPALSPIRELQAEHIRLFVNNYGFVPAVPYASFHLDGGRLMGESWFRLRDIMAESGVSIDPWATEMEDHLAVLLEFCAGRIGDLIEGKTVSTDGAMEALTRVTFDYIAPMIRRMAGPIDAYAEIDFYRLMSRALDRFICEAGAIFDAVFGTRKKPTRENR